MVALAVLVQDLTDTAHPLVGMTLVEIKDGDFYGGHDAQR
jgi:hypothetical protein